MCVTRKQTLLKVFVVVMPKEGWARVASFFWYDTTFSEFDSADIIDYILKKSVSCQKKDGFSRDMRHIQCMVFNILY